MTRYYYFSTFGIGLALLVLLVLLPGCQRQGLRPDQAAAAVTVVLVRHAEKATGADPELTLEGRARAQRLAVMLQNLPIAAVYSTDTRRTRQTAQPTADDRNLRLQTYRGDQLDDFQRTLLRRHRGQTVLVVGHSDTTPALATLLAPGQEFPPFPDDDYSNVYIVTLAGLAQAQVLRLKF